MRKPLCADNGNSGDERTFGIRIGGITEFRESEARKLHQTPRLADPNPDRGVAT
jgi:hypothetical protein